MNDATHTAWSNYLQQCADAMELHGWQIVLNRDTGVADTEHAKNFIAYGQRRVWINLTQKFFGCDRAWQREIIAHELAHCHLEDLSESVRLYLSSNNDMDGVFAQIFQREMEVLVDTLARLIAAFLPLPPKERA
jgi:hypothetical protein